MGPQAFDTVQEDCEAVGAVALAGHAFCHPAGAVSFLEAGDKFPNIVRRFRPQFRVTVARLPPDIPKSLITKGSGQRRGFAQIPRLQFLAHYSDQCVFTSTLSAKLSKPVLQCETISAVVIAYNDEPDSRLLPIS